MSYLYSIFLYFVTAAASEGLLLLELTFNTKEKVGKEIKIRLYREVRHTSRAVHYYLIDLINLKMNSHYLFERNTHYLKMKISGVFDYMEFISMLGIISLKCYQENMFKVLVDTLDVDFSSLSTLNRYDLGKEIASKLTYKIRIAVVVPTEYIDKLMENTAVNRGAEVLVVPSIEAARDWLIEKK